LADPRRSRAEQAVGGGARDNLDGMGRISRFSALVGHARQEVEGLLHVLIMQMTRAKMRDSLDS
jgi:hypothetical protein